MNFLQELVAHAGPPISDDTPRFSANSWEVAGSHASALLTLLFSRNGFYAYDSALLVRPATQSPGEVGIDQWNAPEGWRADFGGLAEGVVFFAEDLFGTQFGLSSKGVFRFEVETGERFPIASDLESWAKLIVTEPEVHTGWPLAREWIRVRGNVAPGRRLVPILPFALGGEYTIENLHALPDDQAMRFYAGIAVQVHGMAEGTQIHLKVDD